MDAERNMADQKKGGVDSGLSSSYMGVVLQMHFIREWVCAEKMKSLYISYYH